MTARRRLLHSLSQRPARTGSGVTLEALARHAAGTWDQAAVIGVPAADPHPAVGGLDPDRVHPLVFETDALPFPVPGMSDIMPYPSTVWSAMPPDQLAAYRAAWRAHLQRVVDAFRPDVIHSHHVWLMTALLRQVAPDVPLVAHCHATGLRQRALCPRLGDEVAEACARIDRFVTVSADNADALTRALGVPRARITVVGAGYRDRLFHQTGAPARPGGATELVYVGKYAAAKGLPWLLDALEALVARHPERPLRLHVAGSGAGAEADRLRARMQALSPRVVLHGQLPQSRLADLLRRCDLCVLPSLYEGVPLVLVEALACGCRLVSTALPGVVSELAPTLGDALHLVEPPRLQGVDVPVPDDLPGFVGRLTDALDRALEAPAPGDLGPRLTPFTWRAVAERVAAVWQTLRP